MSTLEERNRIIANRRAKDQVNRVCEKCVLPESPTIKLDIHGICNVCNSESLNRLIAGKADNDKLSSLIEQTRKIGKSSDYDCLVGWSGGRDSTYLLYELVTRHKLRCVAILGRTPFTPLEIVDNVRSIARRLGVKLIEFRTPKNHAEVARYCLITYAKTKMPILINLACASCKDINREILKQAKELRIRTVIYGGNRYEYLPLGPAAIDIVSDDRFSFATMIKDNMLRLLRGLRVIATKPRLLKYGFVFFKASILYVNFYTVYLRLRYPGIERFDYFLFADWDENQVLEVLKKLDWKLPAGCNSTWRADCAFEAIKNKAFEYKLGFTYAHAMYSNLIRANKIARCEAVARLKREAVSEERLKEALRVCNLPGDFLADIDAQPPPVDG